MSNVPYNERQNLTSSLRDLQRERHQAISAQGEPSAPPATENYNPQPTVAQMPSHNVPIASEASQGSWSCPSCTYLNQVSVQKCAMCNVNNSSQPSLYAPAYSAPQAPSNPDSYANYGNQNQDSFPESRGIYRNPLNDRLGLGLNQTGMNQTDDPTPIYCCALFTPLCGIFGILGLCLFSRYYSPEFPRRQRALRFLAIITLVFMILSIYMMYSGKQSKT